MTTPSRVEHPIHRRSAAKLLLDTLTLTALSCPAFAQYLSRSSFAPVSGGIPAQVAVGDLNGDGLPDLVLPIGNMPKLEVWLADGHGGYVNRSVHTHSASSTQSTVLAELNGDGHLDALVVELGQVEILLGDGSGGLHPQSIVSTANRTFFVAVGDIDEDGKLDFVTATNPIEVFLGNGAGGFTSQGGLSTGAGGQRTVHLLDVNGDRHLDLVADNQQFGFPPHVAVLIGNGAGSFSAPSFSPGVPDLADMCSADLNLDGNIDLIGLNSTGSGAVMLGNGVGGFGTPTSFSTGTNPRTMTCGDVDLDGRPDLLIVNRPAGSSGSVQLLLGNGLGGFALPTTASALIDGTRPTLWDLDADGGLDLVLGRLDPSAGGTAGAFDVSLSASRSFAITTLNASSSPTAMASGDVNGDGLLDLVTADTGGGTITVRLGTGSGIGFGPASPHAVGVAPNSVAIVDLNGDARSDIVCADGGNNSLDVLLANSRGSLGNLSTVPLASSPSALAVADFDRNGRQDVVVVMQSINVVALLLGNGNGTFQTPRLFPVGSLPMQLAVGDVDGDGNVDVVTANFGGNSVSVLRGNGIGGLLPSASFFVGSNPSGVAIGDLNGDTRPDIVTANLGSNDVSVLLNVGGSGFASVRSFAVGVPLSFVLVTDVDGDGKRDVVVNHSGAFTSTGNRIAVLPGDGAGNLSRPDFFTVFPSPWATVVGDFDRDGRSDLATVNSSTISVLLYRGALAYGTGTAGCAGSSAVTISTEPHVNTPDFGFACTNAPPRAPGLFLLAERGDVLGSDPLQFGLRLQVSLLSSYLLTLGATSDFAGQGRIALPIPNAPSLAGTGYVVQAIWFEGAHGCSPATLGLVASRGLSFRMLR